MTTIVYKNHKLYTDVKATTFVTPEQAKAFKALRGTDPCIDRLLDYKRLDENLNFDFSEGKFDVLGYDHNLKIKGEYVQVMAFAGNPTMLPEIEHFIYDRTLYGDEILDKIWEEIVGTIRMNGHMAMLHLIFITHDGAYIMLPKAAGVYEEREYRLHFVPRESNIALAIGSGADLTRILTRFEPKGMEIDVDVRMADFGLMLEDIRDPVKYIKSAAEMDEFTGSDVVVYDVWNDRRRYK